LETENPVPPRAGYMPMQNQPSFVKITSLSTENESLHRCILRKKILKGPESEPLGLGYNPAKGRIGVGMEGNCIGVGGSATLYSGKWRMSGKKG